MLLFSLLVISSSLLCFVSSFKHEACAYENAVFPQRLLNNGRAPGVASLDVWIVQSGQLKAPFKFIEILVRETLLGCHTNSENDLPSYSIRRSDSRTTSEQRRMGVEHHNVAIAGGSVTPQLLHTPFNLH